MATWQSSLSWLRATDITLLVRCFYLCSAAAIIAVRCVPPLRKRFLDYGPRGNPPVLTTANKRSEPDLLSHQSSMSVRLLDYAATWRVSHSYFLMFYIVSVVLCALWCYDVLIDPTTMSWLLPIARLSTRRPLIGLLLMSGHSVRRLYENASIVVPNPNSYMWVGHFVVGTAFYVCIHVAILAEFADTYSPPAAASGGSLLVVSATLMFLAASLWQHLYHRYLASLKKYTLPSRYGASYIVAPHYTAECVLYFCLAIIAAPSGHFNFTMLCVLAFVVVNLGVTADGTKTWMLGKFRDQQDDINDRWRMLPGLM